MDLQSAVLHRDAELRKPRGQESILGERAGRDLPWLALHSLRTVKACSRSQLLSTLEFEREIFHSGLPSAVMPACPSTLPSSRSRLINHCTSPGIPRGDVLVDYRSSICRTGELEDAQRR